MGHEVDSTVAVASVGVMVHNIGNGGICKEAAFGDMVGNCTRDEATAKCGVSYHISKNGSCKDAGFEYWRGEFTDECAVSKCNTNIPEIWYQNFCVPYTKPPCHEVDSTVAVASVNVTVHNIG